MTGREPSSFNQPVPDAAVRLEAETTFDRNVVVVAGAGTGKTTLLVNRLINLLMREPDPLPIAQVVALTFTNKAATEMKIRLRERLRQLTAPDGGEGSADAGVITAADLRQRYGVTTDRIAGRAAAALRDLEKAQIGTVHSFAAHLLRLYPIEGRVDPAFREDDGLRWAEYFEAQWARWLDRELGPEGIQQARWRMVLQAIGLEELRELAGALSSELVSLPELVGQLETNELGPALREWFAARRARAAELLATYERAKPRKVELMLAAVRDLFGLLLERGPAELEAYGAAGREILDKDLGAAPAGWTDPDFAEAGRLIAGARLVLTVDHGLMADLLVLLRPFVERLRAGFVEEGWLSFDGLLARARTLLRDHPRIRERLKQEYRAILVDEFQDTDPVQYEIVLFLAERPAACSETWQTVALEPGKLFIVGDPKQSIYAFRRADIEAFERVVEKVRSQGGLVLDLSTNFRSHRAVLEVVNAVFDRLLQPQVHLQPANVRLLARPNRPEGATVSGVSLRLIGPEDGERNELESAAVTRAEAETLARWLKEELLAREALTDVKGRRIPLMPGHVALLFRKLTQAQDYLDALRRHGILYVTDGEKHYYRRQEVIDLINLLRVLENPLDRIALVGVLRSPLGGLTDRELVELSERQAFDYRQSTRLGDWINPKAQAVRRLYAGLAELSETVPRVPLPEAIDLLFDRLPVLEAAAASLHGEQAVANLLKVRRMAAALSDRPQLTLSGFVDVMTARLSEQPEEAESALAEESLEAVRVLTIHKAKGLEFPIVILAGLHHGTGPGRRAPLVSQDWSTGLVGLTQGGRCSLGAVVTRDKWEARETVERRRLLYVGMTRAKERVILSGGLPGRLSGDSFLALLREAASGEIGRPGETHCRIGHASVEQTVLAPTDRITRRKRPAGTSMLLSPDWTEYVRRWEQRDRALLVAQAASSEVTATRLLQQADGAVPESPRQRKHPDDARLIGTLAHRVLEGWDFAAAPEGLLERVDHVCRGLSPERTEEASRIATELRELFAGFGASEPYAEVCRAKILAREIPFVIPWNDDGIQRHPAQGPSQSEGKRHPRNGSPADSARPCVMSGTIDLLYRLDGRIWIADYKTDRVKEQGLTARAGEYEVQARVYREAVSRCLGLDQVGFKFIFIRSGTAVEA
jgi:ATP-dependent helicase/nuclease subunit A